jgi:hypothetical protein
MAVDHVGKQDERQSRGLPVFFEKKSHPSLKKQQPTNNQHFKS